MTAASLPGGDIGEDALSRFESLGGDDVLQAVGWEPAAGGLFRGARVLPHQLLALLHHDLERMFDPALLSPAAPGWVRDGRYGVLWPSGLEAECREEQCHFLQDEETRQPIAQREARRLRHRGRGFLALLRGGGVIGVIHAAGGVEPALLDMIEAELERLADGAAFWLLELRTDGAMRPGTLESLSARRLRGQAGVGALDPLACQAVLRQALLAAPFPRFQAMRDAAAGHRSLPFPDKAEVALASGERDFQWGSVALRHGHSWSRVVDEHFLLHASEPERPRTALCWSDLQLEGAWFVTARAAVPISSIAPMRLDLTVFRDAEVVGQASCELSDASRAARLIARFEASLDDDLRIELSATTLAPLQTGERSVARLQTVMLRAAHGEEEMEGPEAAQRSEWMPVVAAGREDERLLHRQVLLERQPWVKSAPDFLLNLAEQELDVSRIQAKHRMRQGRMIDTFDKACVIGFDGILKAGRYFDRYTEHAAHGLMSMARAHGTYQNRATGAQILDGQIVLPRETLDQAEVLDHAVFLGTPDEPDNWGMWLLLGIPGAVEFLNNRDRYDRFLCEQRHPWQRSLLQTLGMPEEAIVAQRRGAAYRCRRVSTLRMGGRDLIVPPHEREIFQDLAARLARGSETPPAEKIFISRLTRTRKGGSYRGLMNEDELIEALVPLGFKVVEPEFLPFAEQVALFAGARVVVGLGGAAMFNTAFCRPGTQVVTIESTTVFLDAHTNLFSSLGLPYGVILGQEDQTDPRPSQRRWRLEVPGAVAAIRRMLDHPS